MKATRHTFLLVIGLATLLTACHRRRAASYGMKPARVAWVASQMTRLMMQDVTNPPLAARFYAYATLAGYEVLTQADSSLRHLQGHLHGYPAIRVPLARPAAPQLAALFAMLQTAGKLQPSGLRLQAAERELADSCRAAGMPDEVVAEAQGYAQGITKAILAYAKQDGYNRISNYPRYTPVAGPGYWYPTPPAFFAGVEPYFRKVRPFLLDSAAQFKPAPPAAFSPRPDSDFGRLMREVYHTSQTMTPAQRQTAAFWDCNPFALREDGHLRMGLKKMSPGAHWMGIAGIACQQSHTSFARTLEVQTVVALVLTDGFIGCWDEKYRSNRIRPETVIRRDLDPTWKPLLQTPPFPEYLSGHSVISTAAAEVLTHYFGPAYAYTDTSERAFGLPDRRFDSFREAAAEAAISRLYGGIHFRDAITQGQQQGRQVGQLAVRVLFAPVAHPR